MEPVLPGTSVPALRAAFGSLSRSAHLPENDPRLSANVRVITLPAYSPELNPVELWDHRKDAICHRVFATVEELRKALAAWLKAFWSDGARALPRIGRGWLLASVNAGAKCRCHILADEYLGAGVLEFNPPLLQAWIGRCHWSWCNWRREIPEKFTSPPVDLGIRPSGMVGSRCTARRQIVHAKPHPKKGLVAGVGFEPTTFRL